jgi:hypothetical protein
MLDSAVRFTKLAGQKAPPLVGRLVVDVWYGGSRLSDVVGL